MHRTERSHHYASPSSSTCRRRLLVWLYGLCCCTSWRLGHCRAQPSPSDDEDDIRKHVVHVLYTSTDETTGVTTLLQKDDVATVDDTDNTNTTTAEDGGVVYEFNDFPNAHPSPSGLRWALDVSLTTIRIVLVSNVTTTTTTTPTTDRLYVYFDSPFLEATLVSPESGLPAATDDDAVAVSFTAVPSGYELVVVDPQNPGLAFFPTVPLGGLAVTWANVTSNGVMMIPDALEFAYGLEVSPTSAPSGVPTSAPSKTFMPSDGQQQQEQEEDEEGEEEPGSSGGVVTTASSSWRDAVVAVSLGALLAWKLP